MINCYSLRWPDAGEAWSEQCKRTRRLLAVTCLVKDLSLTIAWWGENCDEWYRYFNAEQRRISAQTQGNVVQQNDLFKGEEEQKIKVAIVGGGPGGCSPRGISSESRD